MMNTFVDEYDFAVCAEAAKAVRMETLLPDTDGMNETFIRMNYPHLPRIYEVHTDQFRFATQADIDSLLQDVTDLGRVSQIISDRRKRLGLKP